MPAQAVGDLPTGAPERTVLKVLSTRILPDLCLMEFPLFPDTAFDSPECRFAALRPVFTPVKDSDGMDAVASYTLRLLDLLTGQR
mgnify:CR=1 FL=1